MGVPQTLLARCMHFLPEERRTAVNKNEGFEGSFSFEERISFVSRLTMQVHHRELEKRKQQEKKIKRKKKRNKLERRNACLLPSMVGSRHAAASSETE